MPKHSIDPYQRIMLGYAGFDVLYGFFYWFMGTWLTPRETGWWGAVGNGKTCEMQGFFFYFWYGSAVYQMTLSLQMLLLVVYMWTPVQFEQLLERKLHAFNIISTLFLATLPLFFDGYNPECGTCRLVPAPAWCGDWVLADRYALHAPDDTTTVEDAEQQCLGGNATLANIYQFFFWIVVILITLFCTASMLSIYLSVVFQEKRMARYDFGNDDGEYMTNSDHRDGGDNRPSVFPARRKKNKESKRIRQTMMIYVASFYVCWIVPMVLWYVPHGVGGLYMLGDFLFALMGFFQCLVFTHPKCVKYQETYPGTPLILCYFYIVFNNQIRFVKGLTRSEGVNAATTRTRVDSIEAASGDLDFRSSLEPNSRAEDAQINYLSSQPHLSPNMSTQPHLNPNLIDRSVAHIPTVKFLEEFSFPPSPDEKEVVVLEGTASDGTVNGDGKADIAIPIEEEDVKEEHVDAEMQDHAAVQEGADSDMLNDDDASTPVPLEGEDVGEHAIADMQGVAPSSKVEVAGEHVNADMLDANHDSSSANNEDMAVIDGTDLDKRIPIPPEEEGHLDSDMPDNDMHNNESSNSTGEMSEPEWFTAQEDTDVSFVTEPSWVTAKDDETFFRDERLAGTEEESIDNSQTPVSATEKEVSAVMQQLFTLDKEKGASSRRLKQEDLVKVGEGTLKEDAQKVVAEGDGAEVSKMDDEDGVETIESERNHHY